MKTILFTMLNICIVSIMQAQTFNASAKENRLFLEPILGFNISLGSTKEDIIDKLDSLKHEKDSKFRIPNYREFYTGKKKVKLPEYENDVVIDLGFQYNNNKLVGYSVEFEITKGTAYFYQLIHYIEKFDVDRINAFLYDKDVIFYREYTKDKVFKMVFTKRISKEKYRIVFEHSGG